MSISTPNKITVPFANSASSSYKRTVPVPSQISVTPGAASFTDGFPPLTMTPKASGGVPPFGQDMNGILNNITSALQYSQAGGAFAYDGSFASTVGGYPIDAIVKATDNSGFWLNQSANNTTDPESFGAGWAPYYQYGETLVTMTSSNVTLTALQAAKDIIVLSGALTTNLNLVLPTWLKSWTIINNCTGSFSVTAKTASGSGIGINAGSNVFVYSNGVNILSLFGMLGNNQTYQNVTSSRAFNSTYTNSTPSPILCVVSVVAPNNANLQLVVDGISLQEFGNNNTSAFAAPITFVVQPYKTYELLNATGYAASTLSTWMELR